MLLVLMRQEKKARFCAQQPVKSATVVQEDDISSAKCTEKETKTKASCEFLTEPAELRAGVAPLKALSAELAHIEETLQQSKYQSLQHAQPPVMQPDRVDLPGQQYFRAYSPLQVPAPRQPLCSESLQSCSSPSEKVLSLPSNSNYGTYVCVLFHLTLVLYVSVRSL